MKFSKALVIGICFVGMFCIGIDETYIHSRQIEGVIYCEGYAVDKNTGKFEELYYKNIKQIVKKVQSGAEYRLLIKSEKEMQKAKMVLNKANIAFYSCFSGAKTENEYETERKLFQKFNHGCYILDIWEKI